MGRSLFEVFPDNPHDPASSSTGVLRASMITVLKTKKPHKMDTTRYDIPSPLGDGSFEERYWSPRNSPVLDDHGELVAILHNVEDVTSLVRSENNASEAEDLIRDLKSERDLRERFVAALTHDLRTPLTSARMSAQLLPRRLDDPVQTNKLCIRIIDQIDRTQSMIRDLLDASRIKAGEPIPIEVQDCDLHSLLKATIEDLSTIHGNRFLLHGQKDIKGLWDSSALRRVLENLINNAVKYGTEVTPVTILAQEISDMVEIAVHNMGNPLMNEEIENIFEPFQRSGSAHQSSQKGWGIGLTLVKGLAEAHGGRVFVSSSKELGTKFSVIIPKNSGSRVTPG